MQLRSHILPVNLFQTFVFLIHSLQFNVILCILLSVCCERVSFFLSFFFFTQSVFFCFSFHSISFLFLFGVHYTLWLSVQIHKSRYSNTLNLFTYTLLSTLISPFRIRYMHILFMFSLTQCTSFLSRISLCRCRCHFLRKWREEKERKKMSLTLTFTWLP